MCEHAGNHVPHEERGWVWKRGCCVYGNKHYHIIQYCFLCDEQMSEICELET